MEDDPLTFDANIELVNLLKQTPDTLEIPRTNFIRQAIGSFDFSNFQPKADYFQESEMSHTLTISLSETYRNKLINIAKNKKTDVGELIHAAISKKLSKGNSTKNKSAKNIVSSPAENDGSTLIAKTNNRPSENPTLATSNKVTNTEQTTLGHRDDFTRKNLISPNPHEIEAARRPDAKRSVVFDLSKRNDLLDSSHSSPSREHSPIIDEGIGSPPAKADGTPKSAPIQTPYENEHTATVSIDAPATTGETNAELAKLRKQFKVVSDLEENLISMQFGQHEEIDKLVKSLHNEQVNEDLGSISASSLSGVSSVQRAYPTIAHLRNVSEARLRTLNGIGPVKARDLALAVNDSVRLAKSRRLTVPFPDEVTKKHRSILVAAWRLHQYKQIDPSIVNQLSARNRELKVFAKREKRATDRLWKIFGMSKRAKDRKQIALEFQSWRKQPLTHKSIGTAFEMFEKLKTPSDFEDLRRLYRQEFSSFTAILERMGVQLRQRDHGDYSNHRQRVSRTQRPSKRGSRRPTQPQATRPITRAWNVPTDGNGQWGGLPANLAQKIEQLEVQTEGLKVTLRPYQEFGVAFAAIQKRVVLGDEMGLGKTIEALALMTHIRSTEQVSHFVVVCPASIISNWAHEIKHRSNFKLHVVHGQESSATLSSWHREGGIALTSYSTARNKGANVFGSEIGLVVADECHYLKNPSASRTQVFAELSKKADRILLMSGTPMENRVEEFVDTIRLVNSTHAAQLESKLSISYKRQLDFRRDVAPVYLRRKQDDVLQELPRLVETDDWLQLDENEMQEYLQHETGNHIMSIRRWTTTGNGADTAKLRRFDEILDECRQEGFKVVVFSFFLDVLDAVTERVDDSYRIDGSISPKNRFALIEEFSKKEGFALLASQIVSGGVGVNIQAANVVILMEPQFKPTTEWQAIARVYRMGQTRTVLVHRLLAEGTIDEDLFALVSEKAKAFNAFADGSVLKDESEMAVASSEAALKTILQERIRKRQLAS